MSGIDDTARKLKRHAGRLFSRTMDELGLCAREVALRAGVGSRNNVVNWERGKGPLGLWLDPVTGPALLRTFAAHHGLAVSERDGHLEAAEPGYALKLMGDIGKALERWQSVAADGGLDRSELVKLEEIERLLRRHADEVGEARAEVERSGAVRLGVIN